MAYEYGTYQHESTHGEGTVRDVRVKPVFGKIMQYAKPNS